MYGLTHGNEPKNRTEKAYNDLKKMLFQGEIVPGQKLQYEDIAKRIGVSRTPIKEVFQILTNEGYLVSQHNKGFYVAEISMEELNDLYDIRLVNERLAVKRAIAHLNGKSTERIKSALDRHINAGSDNITREILMLDADFHIAISYASENEPLLQILRNVFSRIYLKIRLGKLSSKRREKAKEEHLEIFNAILAKNEKLAEKLISMHILKSQRNDQNAQIP